jgi:hypothetical protein
VKKGKKIPFCYEITFQKFLTFGKLKLENRRPHVITSNILNIFLNPAYPNSKKIDPLSINSILGLPSPLF